MAHAAMAITGVILAGGRGSRMGGLDKGLVQFHGRPLVAHVIERLQPQVQQLLINANRELDYYSSLGYPVIRDAIEDYAGPLAGLHSGLTAASHEYVLTVPCDSPLLPDDLADRLLQALLSQQADIAVASTMQRAQPVFCLCKKNLLADLERFLFNGGRKVEQWQKSLAMVQVAFDDQPMAFSNINTSEELAKLQLAQPDQAA